MINNMGLINIFLFTVVYTTSITANETIDYSPKSHFLVMVPFAATIDIYINITDDDVMEPEETFTVNIAGLGVGDGLTFVVINIIDNDRKYTLI